MDFPMNGPRMPRRGRSTPWIVLAIIILFLAIPAIAAFVIDILWFRELGRADVYWTLTWGQWLLGGLVGVGFFVLVFTNIFIALRKTTDDLWADLHRRLHARALDVLDRTMRRIAVWGSAAVTLFFAFVVGNSASQYWSKFLLFLHARPVGTTDPIFQRDISFYFFRMPIWELLSGTLFTALIFAFILTAVVYLATRAIRTIRGVPVFSPQVQAHLSILLGLIFAAKAWQYYLGRFTLMSATAGNFAGPGYTDVHARIPGLLIMTVLALFAAVLMFVNIRRRTITLPIAAFVGLILASIIVLGIYPSLVQRFRVDPNELALESPYLQNHIRLTRQAYGLDNVREESFTPTPRVTNTALTSASATVNNIRLWDYRPLLQVYSQRQDLRTYYDIANVDVDRYQINGSLRQVMLAARELNVDNIAGATTWQNRHLTYTHG